MALSGERKKEIRGYIYKDIIAALMTVDPLGVFGAEASDADEDEYATEVLQKAIEHWRKISE